MAMLGCCLKQVNEPAGLAIQRGKLLHLDHFAGMSASARPLAVGVLVLRNRDVGKPRHLAKSVTIELLESRTGAV